MKWAWHWPGLAALALCVAGGGCGKAGPKLVPVSGIVTNGDKPVPSAIVQFAADISQGGGLDAYGQTDADGRFTLQTIPHGPGAMVGSYKVVVTTDGPGARLIPRKFTDLGSTTLYVEIREGGSTDLKLDLGKEKAEAKS